MTLFHKQVFQKMNLDEDVRALRPGEYRRLNNGIPIKGTVDGYLDGVVSNILGNAIINNYDLAAGTNKEIGSLEDKVGQRMFYFIYNSNNDHTIYQFKDNVITRVFRSSLLGFTSTQFVDAAIIEDILIFTNGSSDIFKINVTKAMAGITYSPAIEEITLIKRPPQLPLTIDRDYDHVTPWTQSFFLENYFAFIYQYVYEDNELSVWSAPSFIMDQAALANSYDRVSVTLQAGENIPYTVKQINYAVSVNGGDFYIYKSDFITYSVHPSTHYFFNNLLGSSIVPSERLKFNDSVPITCQALRVFKNRVFTLNNTEGYDYTPTPISGFVFSSVLGATTYPSFKHRGSYQVGIMFHDGNGRHAGIQLGTSGIVTIPDRLGSASPPQYLLLWDVISVVQASIPLWATHYSLMITKVNNISYFIQDKTADIFYYKKDSAGTITYSKPTYSAANDGIVIDISHLPKYNIGYTFNAGDRIILYDTAAVLKDFIIRSQDGRFLFVDNFDLSAVLTAGVTNIFFEIYTPKAAQPNEPFYEAISIGKVSGTSTGSDVWQAAKYAINDPGTGSRAFSVTSGYLMGDTDLAERKRFYSYTGYSATAPYSNTMSESGPPGPQVMGMNPWSKNFDNWAVPYGTSRNTIQNLIGSKQQSKVNYLRWSQLYVQNSLINGLNTFEALDDFALQIKNGPGTRLVDDGAVMIAIHQAETGSVYIGDGFIKTTDGSQFLSKTDNVVGDDRVYGDGHGTTYPKSVVVNNGRVYFPDVNRGHIIRRSQDGLTRISDYGVRGLVSDICRQAKESVILGYTPTIIAGWDSQYECYVITFKIPSSSYTNGITLYFHERTNSWVCTSSMVPGLYGSFKDRQIQFLNGDLWLQNKGSVNSGHNNWFGVQYTRGLGFEVGSDSLEKIWESIEVDAEAIYATAGVNEVVLYLYDKDGGTILTFINYADFVLRGSAYRSAFFRYVNDANFATQTESKYKSSHAVRGQSAFMSLLYNGTDRGSMKSITIGYRPSLISNP